MNQLKVTGMLSSPCSPFGQPTAPSVPHEALRIFGTGRESELALFAPAAGRAMKRATQIAEVRASRVLVSGSHTGTDLI